MLFAPGQFHSQHADVNVNVCYVTISFKMENLDEEDRSVRREGKDLNTKLINYILLYEKVLRTKWQNILTGKMDWVDDCRKATMCVIRELSGVEYDRCKGVFEM